MNAAPAVATAENVTATHIFLLHYDRSGATSLTHILFISLHRVSLGLCFCPTTIGHGIAESPNKGSIKCS